jgi:winged helix-turn helix protein
MVRWASERWRQTGKEGAMVQRRQLVLTPEERTQLERARGHDPRPYVRERCAALVKVADGQAPHAVALHGLLKRRDPDTVYWWLDLYEHEGLAGLARRRHGGSRRRCL